MQLAYQCRSGPIFWCNGVVELDRDNESDAPVSVENRQQRAQGVKPLSNHDAAFDRAGDPFRSILSDEARPARVTPAREQQKAEQQDVGTINRERRPVADELGHQPGRKRHHRHREHKREMDPRGIAIGAGEVIELRLLADPKDAKVKQLIR